MAELQNVDQELAIVQPDLLDAFAEFLRLDVANGDASADTIRGYKTQVTQWVEWCRGNGINPATATSGDVKSYRLYLVDNGYKATSIAHKLTIIRRFYAAGVDNGLRPDNPAAGVKPPKDKRAQDDFHYLSEVDYTLLLRAVPKTPTEKNLRDKAIIALMGLQGLRTVEIERANIEDLKINGDVVFVLVRGKGHDRVIYLRPDVADILTRYLAERAEVHTHEEGIPMFTACGNRAGGKRISRRGVRQVVDFYLKKADLKRPGISDHALRHTAATLAYKYTQDLRGSKKCLDTRIPRQRLDTRM
ncbi:tyrosine-type recombinase/integrase [Alicyclobacillus fastidiosus]|uniref:tyrosine-type recombinase/integrase n=1 Tax=Alicyclobacillus fastidiosus TaxID=392011 RepID=UPI0023E98DEB|nr:tyrosine-type recombinase/integrase [Alicyclobacillus fastidiosus]GMA66310.1 tyrosine recombinase XerD [Alicyclobacillus fastidiosus]